MVDDAQILRALADRHSEIHVECGAGTVRQVGALAQRVVGKRRVLLITDPAIRAAGHAGVAEQALRAAGCDVVLYDAVQENPTEQTVIAAANALRDAGGELIVGVGGGSVMDAAKGLNLLLRCDRPLAELRGDPAGEVLAARPALLPMILVPTTAGTGSEAQSFAVLADTVSHMKYACGDRRPPGSGGLRPVIAVLDPELTRTVPQAVAAATGLDALTHAVETAGTRVRTPQSQDLSRRAFVLLTGALPAILRGDANERTRLAMLVGAHLAGAAIERSMLGAAHACANAVTARCDLAHGLAVALLLPAVLRFNCLHGENPYDCLELSGSILAETVENLRTLAAGPSGLSELGIERRELPKLAGDAAAQWTARFNPRPVTQSELLEIFEASY